MKKYFAILMALIVVAMLITACKKSNNTYTEPTTNSVSIDDVINTTVDTINTLYHQSKHYNSDRV